MVKRSNCLGVGALAFCSLASAAITITPSTPPTGYTVTSVNGANGWEITIERETSIAATFEISATTATDKINFIHVVPAASYTGQLKLRIGTEDSFPIESIGSITVTGNGAVILDGLAVSGDVGDIDRVQTIEGMVVEGDITGDIFVPRNALNGAGGTIWASSRVEGDVRGNITLGGDLQDLTIQGSFGTAGGAARTIRTWGDVRKLVIGEVLENAVIECRNGNTNALTSIQNLTIDDQWGASGDMNGEIIADTIEVVTSGASLVHIYGDLNGIIDLGSALGERILVDGSFGSGAEINLPANGLTGQISFNTVGGSAAWAGDLKIGSTTYAGCHWRLVRQCSLIESTAAMILINAVNAYNN